MKKMGRPPVKKKDQRNHLIQMKCTEADFELIKAYSKIEGHSFVTHYLWQIFWRHLNKVRAESEELHNRDRPGKARRHSTAS